MMIKLIYEDQDIVVIDKPVGVVSNRASTVKSLTVQDWNADRLQDKSDDEIGLSEEIKNYFKERDGLVHRLDKATSGLMVLAQTAFAFESLLRQFKERQVHKEYLALTHGYWKSTKGVVELPIARARHNRKMMGVREDGRMSKTGYLVEKEYHNWQFPKELKVKTKGYVGFSLVRYKLYTGRMHQIRVHSRHLGHAIVGDEVYAGRKRSREDLKWAGRMLLHSVKLELNHPRTGKVMVWESLPVWRLERYLS